MSAFHDGILDELPSVVGLVLWQNLRHARDWVHGAAEIRIRSPRPEETPPWVLEKRAEARRMAPDLAPALEVFDDWLRPASTVRNRELADACERVARWAYGSGFGHAGGLYAEAAAQMEPHDLRRAIVAARLARDSGDILHAERWFHRIIATARRQKLWEEYIRANLGIGILYMLARDDQRARTHLEHAANKARREGYEWLAAEAQHDLFQFMTVRGHYDAAEAHARTALAWYPKNNPRLPFLVADAAFLLLCRRHHAQAAELLRRFLEVKHEPPHNLLGLGMFVRALGALGERRQFERMRRRLLHHVPSTRFEAAARWHLAEGERAMGRWAQAEREAGASLALAEALRDYETAGFARQTLRDVAARVPAAREVACPAPQLVELADLLTARLDEWAPTRRGRPRRRPPEDWEY